MIKNILPLVVLVLVSACSSVSQVNTNNTSDLSVNNIQNKNISLSFKVKGAVLSNVKSVDAYLVTSATDMATLPSGSYKTSADVVNNEVNINFTNPPTGGPYYVAMQSFDDIMANSATRKNITKTNSTITSSDKQFSISSNSVTVSGGSLTYSTGTAIDLTINLALNTTPVTLAPQDGKPTPTQSILVEEIGNN